MRSEHEIGKLRVALYLIYLASHGLPRTQLVAEFLEKDEKWQAGYEAGRLSRLTLEELQAEMAKKVI